MKHARRVALLVISIAAAGGGAYGLYRLGMTHGMRMATPAGEPAPPSAATGQGATRRHIESGLKAGDIDPASGRRILYYHDPMVPGKRFEQPGQSPFMDMMLVPVYSGGESDDPGLVTVSARIQQALGLRTAQVTEGTLALQVGAIGTVAWNERDQVLVQARTTGFVERVHARAVLDRVKRDQVLAQIYVPDWVAAQEEFLALRRMQGNDLAPLIDAARARMRQAGMTESQIASVETRGTLIAHAALVAPIDGVLTEVSVREGMTVTAGTTLFRINGTAHVWVQAEIPETQLAHVRVGTRAIARSPALPADTFTGRVQSLVPEVNPATRTLKARIEIPDPAMKLAAGMLMEVKFTDLPAVKSMLVPTDAVINTGRRSVVVVAEDNDKFRTVEVQIGDEHDGLTQVKRGLSAGQRVVVSGQFLIDSEANLKAFETRVNASAQPPATHRTQATVQAITADTITLAHPPVASLKWPAMTMDFKLPAPDARLHGLARGDHVDVEFRVGDSDAPQITSIRRHAPAGAAQGRATP